MNVQAFDESLIATLYPARLIVVSLESYQITVDIDLTKIGVDYPVYAEPYGDHCFLVTDSKNNQVLITDSHLNVLWTYGERDNIELCAGRPFSPQHAVSINGDWFIISLRRGHFILIISKDKRIKKVLGTPFWVGGDGQSLWDPHAFLLDNELMSAMCAGSHLSIAKYDLEMECWKNIYSTPPIKKSDLCLPRSCDYSQEHMLLLVSDTEHNRIIGYNLQGIQTLTIDKRIIPSLSVPRCCTFYQNNIMLTCSKSRSIYVVSQSGIILDKYEFDASIAAGQWLQSVEVISNNVLVAFEQEVILLNWNSKSIVWSTKQERIDLKDVHYAQYISLKEYLISDNGNNRLVYIRGQSIRYITSIISVDESINLSSPRFARIIDSKLFVVYSDRIQSIIYVCDPDSLKILGRFGGNKGLGYERVSMPRWICKGPDGKVFISDTGNNRIILREIETDSIAEI